ncbi:TetR/AcrR family transcriptional regulator [Lentibacillus sp. N15]|uniref:TetR/AcrR family transcriptional regulator n=1 Tax=Lentibacillus songyuanensis TaxID=3136161 RepID=UPI0031BB7D27
MDGFAKRKEKKKKQIFSASFELVLKYGFEKVKVDEIALKARVSPATIYNYFGTKEELYQQMLNNWIDSLLKEYEEVLNSDNPFHEKIRDIMTREVENIGILTNLSHEHPESVQYFLHNIENKFESFLIKVIQLGKREGYISTLYSEKVIKKYFKFFFHEINDVIYTNNANSNEEIEQLAQLFFYGLLPR